MSAKPSPHIQELIASRRALLGGLAGLPLLSLADACATAPANSPAPSFTSVAATVNDTVTVPPGYRTQTLVAWGDALFENMPAFDPDTLRRADQEKRFGQNNDMLALFPATYAFPFPADTQRYILCANNEHVEPALMFPGVASLADLTAAHWETFFAAVGCSVVQVEKSADGWRIVRDAAPGGVNRRITPFTPVVFSGAAKQHRWIDAAAPAFNAAENPPAGTVACGTMQNCAGGRTPWGTYLTAEENVNYPFYLTDAGAPGLAEARADAAWIVASGNFDTPLNTRIRVSPSPAQYDVSRNPYGPALYGWVVEIDPYDPSWAPRKRTSLGRKKQECANTAITKDGRVAVYMGDDQIDEFVYKFVTRGRFDPNNRVANRDLLDEGALYAARFDEDGSGEWLELNPENANASGADHAPFTDQGDVAMRAREAARRLGATPMDRPEDVEPLVDAQWRGLGTVLVACTYTRAQAPQRPGNPRRGAAQTTQQPQANVGGHILRIDERDRDCAATRFQWDVFALAGDPDATAEIPLLSGGAGDVSVTLNGQPTFSGDRFACPDNLCLDSAHNVWVATDGSRTLFTDCNECVLVAPTASGPPTVKRFLVGPVGAEICGPTLAFDESAFLCAIQHPGRDDRSGTPISELRWRRGQRPPSNFPDGGESWPRPAVIVVTREDGGKVGT